MKNMFDSVHLSPIEYLECFLLATILNMNAVRGITNLTESNILVYMVYFVYIVLYLRHIPKKIGASKIGFSYMPAIIVLLAYSLCTAIFGGSEAIMIWLKFVVCILLAVQTSKLQASQIKVVLNITVYMALIYAVIVLADTSALYAYMAEGSNYLNVTLPLGFALTIELTNLFINIEKFNIKKSKWIFNCLKIVLLFYTLIQFPARGNLLFPILCVVIIVLIKYLSTPKKLIIISILGVTVFAVLYNIFEMYTSDYLFLRVSGLFTDIGDESRIKLWSIYLEAILSNWNWVFGLGLDQSKNIFGNYPHNFLLELFGELGLIGFFSSIWILIVTAKRALYCNKMVKKISIVIRTNYFEFYLVFSGLLFYLFSYSKSYTVYGGYQLFIMLAMLDVIYRHILKESKLVINDFK